MSSVYNVTYFDGHVVQARVTPWTEITVERKFFALRGDHWGEWVYHLAHEALVYANQETRPFDEWAQAVDDVSRADDDAERPTLPAPSLDGSSESPSEPASV